MTKKDINKEFLKELDASLWKAADKLRSSMDAANYKHVVLGLIFLKYVSDAFEECQRDLQASFKDATHEYYMDRTHYDSDDQHKKAIKDELEQEDYYKAANVLWVPPHARWKNIQEKVGLPIGTVLWQDKSGGDVKFRSVSWLIDNAMDEIEKANPRLKGILNRISQYQLENQTLYGLISDVFSKTDFSNPEYRGQQLNLRSKDILGHVYEYFLGQFALAEGKKGGQYYTPKSIVTLFVLMLEPYKGRVYDPAMGSGGFFVSTDKFIEEHADKKSYKAADQKMDISIYGQEANPTTWKLAAMNMVIRGLDFNFGKKNANTFLDDQHPDLRADYVMANPPFNANDWWHAKLEGDVRWSIAGQPPEGNANFAWMQHMLFHLAPTGSMALLLANGSMSSNTGNEGEIRKRLIEQDLIECMVALPGQLFTNTQIPACIWFLTKDKANGYNYDTKKRARNGEILFIDARNVGFMQDRVLRDFSEEDMAKIADTYHAWQTGDGYADVAGFCYSAKTEEIAKHDYVMTPGRYVGAEAEVEDSEPFDDKMTRLTEQLKDQFAKSAPLDDEIQKNLARLGYEF